MVCDPDKKNGWEINLEMLGKARSLAEENGALVDCLVIGGGCHPFEMELSRYGAQRVLFWKTAQPITYLTLTQAVENALAMYPAELVMFPGTPIGKAAAATVSARMETGLTADCIDIRTDTAWNYIFLRAAMSSSVIAEIVCIQTALSICTVKLNVFLLYS